MKNIFTFIFLFFIFSSCSSENVVNNSYEDNTKSSFVVVKYDTVFVVDTAKIDSLAKRLKTIQDSLVFYRDSIRYNDYINARRIEKINYYIKICKNNPKNKQFFFGWIRRTMTE